VEKHPPSAAPALTDASGDDLVLHSRARRRVRPERIELGIGALLAVAFALAAAAGAAFLPDAPVSPLRFVVLAAAYVAATRVSFEVGSGIAVPTQPIFVPMLFLLPPDAVAPCIATGLVVSRAIDLGRRRESFTRLPLILGSGWHALGPVLVLGLLAPGAPPSWSRLPLYLLAFAAQVVFDFLSSALPDRLAFGLPVRQAFGFLSWVYVTDLALAPLGLLTAIAAGGRVWPVLLLLPLLALFANFARERRRRIDNVEELQHAYRGTALLLGEVVEADDAYTGHHSYEVVELALGVAERMRVSSRDHTLTEFAALLHDVGKVRIPTEIIRKPGPLTPEERTVIETHTILGEEMLARVGGMLGEVGVIVRSCHEHYGGEGYPDRLAGEEIPLIARIVCACDAFSAMTTDRPYRAARSAAEAVAELHRCSPEQFDPRVVAVLAELVDARTDVAVRAAA
jgi:putative nucleotidyltransferase with HDIG domain